MNDLILDGAPLTLQRIMAHVRDPAAVLTLSEQSSVAIQHSSRAVDEIVRNREACYGVNLGFGEMVDIGIAPDHLEDLQRSLILSHAIGVKDRLPAEIARTIFLLRLNSLAHGASGIRPEAMRYLIRLYNHRAYPEIYRAGSLGASGDLGPLAHLAAFAIGEGWGTLDGKRMRCRELMERLGIEPLVLARKEGLALINGTSAMSAIGLHAVDRLRLYLEMMLLGMALLMDSQQIPNNFIDPAAFDLKPHPGSKYVANSLAALLNRSGTGGRSGELPFQQVYSIRCVPFIVGPLVESLRTTAGTLMIEANSVSDNPIFIGDKRYPYHGGHFHGHPVSVALDQLRIAAVALSGVIDRQLEFYFDRKRNPGVKPFFSSQPEYGHCGLEGAQYLVTSLHVENKALANPFSTMVVPTNAGNQDYVSMGMQSALNTLEMADNMQYIVGVYLFAALQSYALQERPPSGASLAQAAEQLAHGFSFPYRDETLFAELIDTFAKDLRYQASISQFSDRLELE